MKLVDLSGRRFDRLLVLSYSGGDEQSWLCRCDCGTEKIIRGQSLKGGLSRSCGCLSVQATIERQTTHKMTKSPEYIAWQNAKDRCLNPDSQAWPRYGARGIKVCDAWLNDFPAFFEHIGPRPSPEYSLDRYPNNDGNYEPGNVRWATDKQQKRNTSKNRLIFVLGEQMCIAEAAERFNVRYKFLAKRISRGWSPERALGLST